MKSFALTLGVVSLVAAGSVFAAAADRAKAEILGSRGAEVLVVPDSAGQVDLAAMLAELGRRGDRREVAVVLTETFVAVDDPLFYIYGNAEIGRASCRERV